MDSVSPNQMPSLLQLCAEKLADYARKNENFKKHLTKFGEILFPNIHINYIEDNLFYSRCEFMKYINIKNVNIKLIPTLPKGCENKICKITVGDEKAIYVSPIYELGRNMLKLDFPEGEYELCPFDEGYILKTKEYLEPKLEDAMQSLLSIGNNRSIMKSWKKPKGDENIHHLRLFNEYISEYISKKWWEYATPGLFRLVVKSFKDFNDIPVVFYLTKQINVDDLDKITLSCPSVIKNCSNVQVCWDVVHTEKGRLGVVIKQKEFLNLVVDPPNVGVFAFKEHRAIGNVDLVSDYNRYGKITRFYLCHGIMMRVPGATGGRGSNSEQPPRLPPRPRP